MKTSMQQGVRNFESRADSRESLKQQLSCFCSCQRSCRLYSFMLYLQNSVKGERNEKRMDGEGSKKTNQTSEEKG